jgi:hypothetical protein
VNPQIAQMGADFGCSEFDAACSRILHLCENLRNLRIDSFVTLARHAARFAA